ncbi:RP-S16, MRPS16, rpsP [Phaffia rhodozyma]|uniref:RP-S16, MRPS16, rpsP n=1 Tax=Phaffia rhodozyma TaxID=264483 RepID=A0A0F7SJX7_PHARH|nr:RP-S16, MRPS16, rpsP [Phaffia rhodozyma]
MSAALKATRKDFALQLPKPRYVPSAIRNAKIRLRMAFTTGPRDFRRVCIVATTSRTRRDGMPLEKLGEYDPTPKNRKLSAAEGGMNFAGRDATRYEKRVEWNEERILWWLKYGKAEPSTKVVTYLEKAGVLQPGHPYRNGKPPPVPTRPFIGNWPEFDPLTPATVPNGRVQGLGYVLPKKTPVESMELLGSSPVRSASSPKRSWRDHLKGWTGKGASSGQASA